MERREEERPRESERSLSGGILPGGFAPHIRLARHSNGDCQCQTTIRAAITRAHVAFLDRSTVHRSCQHSKIRSCFHLEALGLP